MRRASVIAMLALGLVSSGFAQVQPTPTPLTEAFDLERVGRYAEAAERYRAALKLDRASLPALLGLERVLAPLSRLDSLVPLLDTALTLQPGSRMVRAIQLRVWNTLGQTDSLSAAARRWIARDTANPDPYREWAFAVAQRGDVREAQRILRDGAFKIGGSALVQEMAQLAGTGGDWPQAARYWRQAVKDNEALAAPAALGLERAPAVWHQPVLDALLATPEEAYARRVAADLLVGWGRPRDGWSTLESSLPVDRPQAVTTLQRFADRARLLRTPEGARARGLALERIAELATGDVAARARVDAARAFADAGERVSAERVLQRIAEDPASDKQTALAAMGTLIGVMTQSGRVNDAEERLRAWATRLPGDEARQLRHDIARAWIRRGELPRATAVLGPDSSTDASAIRGWIALYQGDIAEATEAFRSAGPYAGSRTAATERAALLAILQRIEPDSLPEFGKAMLLLARGDTGRAVTALAEVARGLPASGGRADLLGLAGRLAASTGDDDAHAVSILEAAIAADSSGPASPAAFFALAELDIRGGRPREAMARLESLILTFPQSAVVPQARRLLDQVRGAVPRS